MFSFLGKKDGGIITDSDGMDFGIQDVRYDRVASKKKKIK